MDEIRYEMPSDAELAHAREQAQHALSCALKSGLWTPTQIAYKAGFKPGSVRPFLDRGVLSVGNLQRLQLALVRIGFLRPKRADK